MTIPKTNSEIIKAYLDKGLWVEAKWPESGITSIYKLHEEETSHLDGLNIAITPIARPFSPYNVGEKVIILDNCPQWAKRHTDQVWEIKVIRDRTMDYMLGNDTMSLGTALPHYCLAPHLE